MGTRGCVAVGTPDRWIGCYNHFDSYPTGLGADVWAEWKENPNLPEDLLKFGDWREYLNGGICEYCGKKRGQPHSILVNEHTMRPGGDPDALYHEHNDAELEDKFLTQDQADPLFIEWVYILDPEKQAIHILSNVGKEDYEQTENSPGRGERRTITDDGYVDYGHCAYKHVYCRTISLNDAEPDWHQLENDISRELYPEYYVDEEE